MEDLNHKRITVAGLGHFGGGINVARWLVDQGAKVCVTDLAPADKLSEGLKLLEGLPIEYHLGGHRLNDFTEVDLVVTSPAIPPTSEYLRAATNAGVPITTEIRLFLERCPARTIVGVTGTKGKSTTTKLLSLMLSTRHTTWTGGNIGGSLLFDLPKIADGDLVVLELSSYMLEHLRPMRWSPRVTVVTMIGIDHVQWHGSADAYVDAKRNLVRFQKPDDIAILSEEESPSAAFAPHTPARIVRYKLDARRPFILTIPGKHNQLNAQAAFCAANELGIEWDRAQQAVKDFTGLPHRLQLVHTTRAGVRYFNDSIATIPEAAIAAMDSFPAGHVIQIVGGYDKGLDTNAMCRALADRAKAVLTVGATGPAIAQQIRANPQAADRVFECGQLSIAMDKARQIAVEGDVVLLSTGFASYDQFSNFEERGNLFAKLARGE